MPKLCLSLLGPVEITLNERSVTPALWPKHLALLAYLSVEADRPHRREALAGMLWPEQPEDAARHSLREALYQLHKTLGPGFSDFFTVTSQTAQFNLQADHSLDVADFVRFVHAAEGHRHKQRETCSHCVGWLQEAVALYRGHFLVEFALRDSCAFDEWVLVKREQTARLALEALHTLAESYQLHGDYIHMEEMARRQLEISPLQESAHRQVMQALAWQGSRNAALAHYNQFARLLAVELGVSPEKQTNALYARLQAEESILPLIG